MLETNSNIPMCTCNRSLARKNVEKNTSRIKCNFCFRVIEQQVWNCNSREDHEGYDFNLCIECAGEWNSKINQELLEWWKNYVTVCNVNQLKAEHCYIDRFYIVFTNQNWKMSISSHLWFNYFSETLFIASVVVILVLTSYEVYYTVVNRSKKLSKTRSLDSVKLLWTLSLISCFLFFCSMFSASITRMASHTSPSKSLCEFSAYFGSIMYISGKSKIFVSMLYPFLKT